MKKDDKKSKDAQLSTSQEVQQETSVKDRVHSILHIPASKDLGSAHCCGGLTYILLAVVTIIIAVIEVIVTSLGAATERSYDTPHSGRLVAMVVLAVVAATTIGMIVYGIIGVRKKHTKPLHTTAIVLLILVVIQALIAGISVKITQYDELNIARSLSESFVRARDGDPAQVELWDATQYGLECCGFYSPEDYRDPYGPLNYPPDIPASCCPVFKHTNTTRDKNREMCKANNTFFKAGCKPLVLEIVKGASISVIIITVLLMTAEVIIAILGAILSKKRKEEKHEQIEISHFKDPPKVVIVNTK